MLTAKLIEVSINLYLLSTFWQRKQFVVITYYYKTSSHMFLLKEREETTVNKRKQLTCYN